MGPYIPELTINSTYVHYSRVGSNTFTVGNPMPESTLTLCHSQLYPPVRDFRFSLCTAAEYIEPEFVNLLRIPGIDSQPGRRVGQPYLTHRPARLHMLAESIPWNRFLSSFKRLQIRALSYLFATAP
jgi:hypothetical protein